MSSTRATASRHVLGTRVGRRLTLLFLGCALVPLAGFGWLALRQVSDSLHAEVDRTLHQSAKSAGMDLARGLLSLADELEIGAAMCNGGAAHLAAAPEPVREELESLFSSICVVRGTAITGEVGIPPAAFAPLLPEERHHLASGKALARVVQSARGAGLQIIRPLGREADAPLLVAAVRSERLLDIESLRGSGTEVLVLAEDRSAEDTRRVLSASLPHVPDLEPMDRALGLQTSAGTFAWTLRGEEHLAHYWRVFLQPQLGMDWFIVQSRARAAVEAPLVTFRETFLMAALLTLLLVVAFSVAQIRRTVVPIRQLVEATKRVASGDLDARATIAGRDEFAQLGASFDHMTDQLAANIRQRELTELDLIAARDAALAAVKAKADFLTNVTHELRTPLTSIVGAAEILRDYGGEDPETRTEFVGIVVDQAGRLRRLIEGVLALHGGDTEPYTNTDLATTLDAALARLPAEVRTRIRCEYDGDLSITAAPGRLAYALMHLLDNAAKFSAPDAPIEVRARRRGAMCVVDVVDHGVGIAASDRDRIFEPFVQLGDLLTAKASGIGLGLTLARNIVDSHGGRITVDSTPGKGTTFRVALPAHTGAPGAATAPSQAAAAPRG